MTDIEPNALPAPTPTPEPSRSFPDRVAARAEQIRFTRVILTVIAAPFYLVGLLVGVVWVGLRWVFAAVQEGFASASKRGEP